MHHCMYYDMCIIFRIKNYQLYAVKYLNGQILYRNNNKSFIYRLHVQIYRVCQEKERHF